MLIKTNALDVVPGSGFVAGITLGNYNTFTTTIILILASGRYFFRNHLKMFHEIGRAHVHAPIPTATENENSLVFQKTVENRNCPDVWVGQHCIRCAHDQVHLDARVRRIANFLNDFCVCKMVHLHADVTIGALCLFPRDQFCNHSARRERRHHEVFKARFGYRVHFGGAIQEIEHTFGFFGQAFVCGEEHAVDI